MPSGATNAFVIYRATDGQYYFVIKGGNSEVLMTSETYTRKESAENGIRAVKQTAPNALVVDMTV
jgi:uncharacterized protein YegP (UPF0339 family)